MTLAKEKGIVHVEGIDAGKISYLISKHHSKDVVIEQCKNGPSWSSPNLLILDAWVLERTYSPLQTIGYEIKVSRQDFENDAKWMQYMDYCHKFYFVCPAGLIRAVDLPKEVGLYWTTMKGDGIRLKKYAERHEPNADKLNSLLIYALMSRSKIVADMNEANRIDTEESDRVKNMEDYLRRCEEGKVLAHMIKGHFRKMYDENINREKEINRRIDRLERFEKQLAKLGITWDSKNDSWYDNQQVENQINKLKNQIGWKTLDQMERLSEVLSSTVKNLREVT
ncbi:MAG: MmcB family DNA repair protein, partial [Candidatus Omnitrophica bacterium]|nr:MmcB family DNA repair protein [Candidatus Omnitrophota bacterium]